MLEFLRLKSGVATAFLTAAAAVLAGLYASAVVDGVGPLSTGIFRQVTDLPLVVVVALMLGVVVLAFSARIWWTGAALFFAFLPFEDLLRKFAGNDLRLYSIKYALLAFAFVGALPHLRDAWRKPLGTAWAPTLVVLTVAGIYVLPAATTSPLLPVIGLLTRFGFLLALPIGVVISRRAGATRRFYACASVAAVAVCALGIAQRIIGPEFLNPTEVQANLTNLTIVRSAGDAQIVRPSGPFVDATRFAAATILSVVLALCVIATARSNRGRRLGALALAGSLAGALASGSRTAVVASVGLVTLTQVMGRGVRLQVLRRAVPAVVATALLVALGAPAVSSLASDNLGFLSYTLNPFAEETSDVVGRVGEYLNEPIKAAREGGLVGKGTGTQSLGRQYLGDATLARALVESGFGSVMLEWGVLGLVAWVCWSVAWVRRVLALRSAAAPDVVPIAAFVAVLLFVLFWLHVGLFDNYVTNIFFWCLSGIAFGSTERRADDREPAEAGALGTPGNRAPGFATTSLHAPAGVGG